MGKGISIHVGVNVTEAPEITVPALEGCINDAEAMRLLARSRGFVAVNDEDVTLTEDQATFENVLGKCRLAADQLEAGDIFLFTFSGHGTRRGAADSGEDDDKDETVVLRDRLLVDNIMRKHLWPTFKPGVRVVMVSDSCHSGTVAMSIVDDSDDDEDTSIAAEATSVVTEETSTATNVRRRWETRQRGAAGRTTGQNGFRIRTVPLDQTREHFRTLADFYEELREGLPNPPPKIEASVLLLAACQDEETTRDGRPHGVFTQALLDVWNPDEPKTYKQLIEDIKQRFTEIGMETNPTFMVAGEAPDLSDTEAFKI